VKAADVFVLYDVLTGKYPGHRITSNRSVTMAKEKLRTGDKGDKKKPMKTLQEKRKAKQEKRSGK